MVALIISYHAKEKAVCKIDNMIDKPVETGIEQEVKFIILH